MEEAEVVVSEEAEMVVVEEVNLRGLTTIITQVMASLAHAQFTLLYPSILLN